MKIKSHDLKGSAVAISIFMLWLINLTILIYQFEFERFYLYPLIALQSFLNIGLFITAHDSMHGTVSPQFPKLNDMFGAVALFMYAGFSFKKLKTQHILHHKFPATNQDPDYARESDERFWPWFFHFIRHYFGVREFLLMTIPVTLISFATGSHLKMLLIYALPAVLSALQLFYFGTYLPHRTPLGGHTHPHRSTSNHYPTWLSLLTCYHFGYHQEHHEHPGVPWWKLPSVYQNNTK